MISCEVNAQPVGVDRLTSHWSGWRKAGYARIPYRIVVTLPDVIRTFGRYWSEVMDRESDPDLDDGSDFDGLDAELREARYPDLEEMLRSHGDLFSRYVLRYLQTEFVGFLIDGSKHPKPHNKFDYFLQSLDSLIVKNGLVYLEGGAVEWVP